MGYAPKFFGVDGMDGILTMKGFDTSLAEGVMLLTPFNADSTDERTAAFVKKYQETYGEVPNQFAADAYDCVYAYTQALRSRRRDARHERCRRSATKMIEQFTSMTFDGLTGNGMTWNEQRPGHQEPQGHGHPERRLRRSGLIGKKPDSTKQLWDGGYPSVPFPAGTARSGKRPHRSLFPMRICPCPVF